MMIWFKRRLQATAAIFTIVIAAALAGCTEVDNTLGDNFIPDDQTMSIHMVTLGAEDGDPYVSTYLAQEDSIPTSNTGYMYIGSKISPYLGTTTARAIGQVVPASYSEVDYGYKPAVDSMFINLNVSSNSNIHNVEQTFTAYKVTKEVVRDSMYFANFPYEEYADLTNPLFKFDLTSTLTGMQRVEVDLLPAGLEYLTELIYNTDYNTENTTYQNDSIFIHQFNGLCFVPDEPKSGDGIFKISLSYDYNIYSASHLEVHFHSHLEDYAGSLLDYNANDSLYTAIYYFNDETNGYPQAVNSFEREYKPQILAALNDTLPTSTPVEIAYVEGIGGVYTYLRVNDALVDELKALKGNMAMSVNNARIFFEMENGNDPAVLNSSMTRLGMFYDYSLISYPIPDYNYSYESNYSIPYDGYMNRASGGFYTMDITTYIQRLLDKPSTPRVIELTPSVDALYTFNETALKGSGQSGYKIKIKLTYSLIPN